MLIERLSSVKKCDGFLHIKAECYSNFQNSKTTFLRRPEPCRVKPRQCHVTSVHLLMKAKHPHKEPTKTPF